jgi:hypothetical protein
MSNTKQMSKTKMTNKMGKKGKNRKKEKGDKGKTDTIIDTCKTFT